MRVVHRGAPGSLSLRPAAGVSGGQGLLITVAFIACWWPGVTAAQTFSGIDYTYSIFDIQGAQSTAASGINNLGQIVGSYSDAAGTTHGFLLSPPPFTPFLRIDNPNPGTFGLTVPRGINDAGQVVGSFDVDPTPSNTRFAGFLITNGVFVPIEAGPNPSDPTFIAGINDHSEMAGNWTDPSYVLHGFAISDHVASLDNFIPFGGPNNSGDIVGVRDYGMSSQVVGVLNFHNGAFVPLPVGGAFGINDLGQVVGVYGRTGFFLSGDTYVTVAPPGSSYSSALDVNNLGQIVGSFSDSNSRQHGFLATPVGSSIPIFPTGSVPGPGGAFQFHLFVVGGSPIVLDPVVAVGYEFATSGGPSFQSILLPAIGASMYEIDVWNGSQYVFYQQLAPGVTLSLGVTGVSRFRVLGIDPTAALDPANPLAFPATVSFVAGGEVNVTMTPITVPEPTGIVLAAVAASLMGVVCNRRFRASMMARSDRALTARSTDRDSASFPAKGRS